MPLRLIPLLLLAGVLVALWPRTANADVRRCVTATGETIFTDRKCDEVNATERVPSNPAAPAARGRSGGCARNVQDLVFEITSAIDARDANRLAGVYHWPGTSADEGYRIWTQLDAIANRQLVDIVPVMPSSRPAPVAVPSTSDAPVTRNDAGDEQPAKPADPELYPQTAVGRNPIALRLEQTLGNSATPARTVFGLTHYFGCWWVRF
ncbi:DUF4124 domain-containing protein [Lysobacter tyrosinilyticus]